MKQIRRTQDGRFLYPLSFAQCVELGLITHYNQKVYIPLKRDERLRAGMDFHWFSISLIANLNEIPIFNVEPYNKNLGVAKGIPTRFDHVPNEDLHYFGLLPVQSSIDLVMEDVIVQFGGTF